MYEYKLTSMKNSITRRETSINQLLLSLEIYKKATLICKNSLKILQLDSGISRDKTMGEKNVQTQ